MAGTCVICHACESTCQTCASNVRHVNQLSACESHCQACAWRACASTVRHVNHIVRHVPGGHVRQLSESPCQACASTVRHVNHTVRHVPWMHLRQLSGIRITLSGMCLSGMWVNCQACESHCQACACQACASTVRHVNHTVRHVPWMHLRQLSGLLITLSGM